MYRKQLTERKELPGFVWGSDSDFELNTLWKRELSESYRSVSDFPESFIPGRKEKSYLKTPGRNFGFSVPRDYFSLAGDDENDPIRLQFMPRSDEFKIKEYETSDPLGENQYKVTERLIHRYPDRALFIASDLCAMYCRHCFRRDYLAANPSPLLESEIEAAASYLKNHTEVKELIVSGGDPLILDDRKIANLLSSFRLVRPDIVFRIATRIPVVLPSRITTSLLKILSDFKPLFVITQYNHPLELTDRSVKAVKDLVNNGIPVMNQTVLLKDVNDSEDVLADLFQKLISFSIKPYYLFQGDLAAGTSHLRVPILRGIEIMKNLRTRISGLALPVYAVDLPMGGGKVPLTESFIDRISDNEVILKDGKGKEYAYPLESYPEGQG